MDRTPVIFICMDYATPAPAPAGPPWQTRRSAFMAIAGCVSIAVTRIRMFNNRIDGAEPKTT
jgi:hypothetical protein